jgi:transposase
MELLLNLPNLQVQDAFEDRNGHYMITVFSAEKCTHCHKCGKRIDAPNGHGEWITVRHLPILGKQVYLRIALPRYRCDCVGEPTTTQQPTWFARRSCYTKAFEEHLLLACVNSTVADVAIRERVGYESVNGVIDRNIRKSVDWKDIEQLDILGVDEISLEKGHRDCVAIVTGRCGDKTQLLGVLEGRTKQTVKEFFLSIPKRLRRGVRYVRSDMYDGFIDAAKEAFGKKVRIVADRFHVAKLYRDGLEDLRKKELRRLKRALPATAYKTLKGVMWALRKKEADLTDEDKATLDRLFKHSPLLTQAHAFRDGLTAIRDTGARKAPTVALRAGIA